MGNKKPEVANKDTSLALPEQYFRDNANVGLSSLSIEDTPIPTLSVVQSTSKWRDEEDRPYAPGKFYYKALKIAFSAVECNILVISKKNLRSYMDENQFERTYQVLGIMKPNDMPFLMYNKSSSYFAVRQFIGEVKARKYPMYALKVELTTEKRQNEKGEWFVPVFNITDVETDPDRIVMLESLAKDYDLNQESIKSEDDPEVKVLPSAEVADSETVRPEEVPF